MKHIIIGTAGHVDHGKTALIKALTGIDTDRLEEEQLRGVTIELGFAYLDLDLDLDEADNPQPSTPDSQFSILNSQLRVGVIDVPGHERFIRNMLAGAGGIDLAMLCVAADEGVMPQTREHLGILSQLGIKNGLIVITKLDKVDEDWLELVVEDITELAKNTFLEQKPIIPVSAHTGEALPKLKQALSDIVKTIETKNTNTPFRLPVDRVFPAQGFGIIVTGTLIEGAVNIGDTAEILPMGETVTIRGLQVHGKSVDTAYAGQRTAINLAGAKRLDVERGDVIAACDTLNVANIIDVKLSVLPDSPRKIKSGTELHLYHGARTLLAKVILLGGKAELKSGESGYARFKLREPLPCKRGDRFIMRFYSPLETLGGGVILDSSPKLYRSYSSIPTGTLELREKGTPKQIADLAATELSSIFTIKDLCRRTDLDKKNCLTAVEELISDGHILKIQSDSFISAKVLAELGKKCVAILENYHKKHPLRTGMDIAELRQKLLPGVDTSEANAILQTLKNSGTITISASTAATPNHKIALTPTQENIRSKLLNTLEVASYETPSYDELLATFPNKEQKEAQQVFESMTSSGEIIMLSPQIFWLKDTYQRAMTKLQEHFNKNEEITLAQCRDLLNSSRKYALAFLEYLDRNRITRFEGDVRKKLKQNE